MISLLLASLLAMASPTPGRVAVERPTRACAAHVVESGPTPPAANAVAEEAVQAMLAWIEDPVRFVEDNFGAKCDDWQADALRAIQRDPKVAMSACKGPGKSCSEAWAIWWFLATRPDAQIICTSITEDNLRDGLWKELALWYAKSPYLQATFEVKGERIVSRDRPKTWWVSARSWARNADPSQQANSLAGFHGERVMVVLDEVGDYPEGVVAAAEAIFANEHLGEAKLVVAGNPTSTDGPLYRITSKDRKRWTVIYITGDPDDPKRSPRISKEWAQQQIDDWGRDDDWVRINVLGLFPRRGSNKLLGPDDINLAQARDAKEAEFAHEAKVWGLDPARFGVNVSALMQRQGCMTWKPYVWRGLDSFELAGAVAALYQKHKPDAIFVDVGGPNGGGTFDVLARLGLPVIPVDFGGAASDARFGNKRAEMYWLTGEWVKKRGCLVPHGELASQLCAPSIDHRVMSKRTVMLLEGKDSLEKRGINEMGHADALALTFAAPVEPRGQDLALMAAQRQATLTREDYDPLTWKGA